MRCLTNVLRRSSDDEATILATNDMRRRRRKFQDGRAFRIKVVGTIPFDGVVVGSDEDMTRL